VVSIEGASENIQGADTAPIKFKRTARNSRYLRSVLLLKNGHPAQRAEHVRRLSTDADHYTASLTAALQRNLQITDDDLVLGLRAALIGAALAGLAWPGIDEAELLTVAFADGRSWARQDAADREGAWSRTLEAHLHYRLPLVERLRDALGVAQGDGKPRLIDAARALPLLRRAAALWDWQVTASEVPEWVKPAVTNFANWTSLVHAQNASLRRKLDDVRRHHPRGATGAQVLAAVREALLAAENASIPVPLATRTDITERLARAQNVDWKVLTQLEDELLRAEEPEASNAARIISAVRDRGVTTQVVSGLLQASDAWLTSALAHAASRTNSHGDEAARGVQELLTEWRSLSTPKED
jgi:hypothetical protein